MLPASHKTVFLLEESAHFVNTLCQQKVDFDVSTKGRGQQPSGIIPIDPLEKSLWTCAIEAVSEYCRIIWDVFPDGDRLISFVSGINTKDEVSLSWEAVDQNLAKASTCFARTSFAVTAAARSRNTYGSPIVFGLKNAIERLGELTPVQKKLDHRDSLLNKGRIIVVSHFKHDHEITELQQSLVAIMNDYNNLISQTPPDATTNSCQISMVEFVIVNTYPINDRGPSSKLVEVSAQNLSPCCSGDFYSTKSGTFLAQKLVTLVLKHYTLASTTVTGIPMKEEQNASSSANYDVEIVHPAGAHFDIYKSVNLDSVRTIKEGVEYDTISLKWCTPRTNAVELHYSTGASRLTPVDVNSRPSSCLTNFLLAGRAVMLEMPRAKSGKLMSHMLASHNQELYIHTLSTSRSILEDPPSISEGSGGRVTDYRINDFGELMKSNKLVRCKAPSLAGSGNQRGKLDGKRRTPLEKAQTFLARQTLYWPIVIGHTIIYNLQSQILSLLNLLPKETLSQDEVNECKGAIYQMISMESKGTVLPIPSISNRGKGPKREELYKLLWTEVGHFVKSFVTTPEHQAVLDCLNDVHAKSEPTAKQDPDSAASAAATTTALPPGITGASAIATGNKTKANNSSLAASETKVGLEEVAWKEFDRFSQMTEREKADLNFEQQPSLPKKPRPAVSAESYCFTNSRGQESLLSLWTRKLNYEENSKRKEFAGRAVSGPNGVAQLYPQLLKEQGSKPVVSEQT